MVPALTVNPHRYQVLSRPSDGMAIIQGRPGQQMWLRVTARKANTCQLTGRPIVRGDLVYRPATNGANRMHRILASAVAEVVID